MRRFFIDAVAPQFFIEGEDAHHLMHVLRAKKGQQLLVADAQKKVVRAEIISFEENRVQLQCLEELDADTESPVSLTLVQWLPKGDKMDFIVQKAVELGVQRIIPVAGDHCVVKYDAAKREARRKKWQKIADEAAKQCGRTILPQVEAISGLKEFLKDNGDAVAIMCYEGETSCTLGDFLCGQPGTEFSLLIGPEGGFSQAETALCADVGVQMVTMGPRILRAETASLAAVSIVLYEKGDLGGRSKSCQKLR